MRGGRMKLAFVCALVLVVMGMSATQTQATDWVVGGLTQKWNFLHAEDVKTWYNTDWAANNTFKTGDNLIFSYDNTTHSVVQLSTQTDFDNCILSGFQVNTFGTGHDVVFIPSAGTYFFVCGSPSHCGQGMKVSITATGAPATAPPGGTSPTNRTSPAPSPNHSPPGSLHSTTLLLSLVSATAVAAAHILPC